MFDLNGNGQLDALVQEGVRVVSHLIAGRAAELRVRTDVRL